MKKESTHSYLVRRLSEMKGKQSLIAREIGVSQATVNRISLGNTVPSCDVADRLVAWFQLYDKSRTKKRVSTTHSGRSVRAAALSH